MAQKSEIGINENRRMICTECDSCWLLDNGYPAHAVYFRNAKEYANTECLFKVKSDEGNE